MAVVFMDSKQTFIYGKYLSHLVASTLNNTVPEEPFEGIDWAQFFRLAEFHNVIALVYPAIKNFAIPDHILTKWIYANNRMVAREARQDIEAQTILGIFAKYDIPFIKMKGIVTKHFYPAPYMRAQADIDLCVSEENRKRCDSILENLGYKLFASIENTDEYMKDNFFYYEIHSSVYDSNSDFRSLFADPFSKAVKDKNGVGYVFTDEYFFLHLITHLYKHFVFEGCGLRLFCDLYIYRKAHPNLDMDFIYNTLSDYEITEFYNSITELTECLFGDKDFDQKSTDIATYIFNCGDHGSDTIRRLTNITNDKEKSFSMKNKLKFRLQIYFPPAYTLKNRYRILEKAPVLLPFCWIVRGFSTLFFKRSAIKEQKKIIGTLNSEEILEAQRIQKLAGVKQK